MPALQRYLQEMTESQLQQLQQLSIHDITADVPSNDDDDADDDYICRLRSSSDRRYSDGRNIRILDRLPIFCFFFFSFSLPLSTFCGRAYINNLVPVSCLVQVSIWLSLRTYIVRDCVILSKIYEEKNMKINPLLPRYFFSKTRRKLALSTDNI